MAHAGSVKRTDGTATKEVPMRGIMHYCQELSFLFSELRMQFD
jgi:hypothetical protein